MAQLIKNLRAMQETWVRPLGRKIPWRRERLPTPVFWSGEFHGLYSLRGCKESEKRVTRTQARFLQLCLEHSLADCNDIHLLESEANSAGESPPPEMGAKWEGDLGWEQMSGG